MDASPSPPSTSNHPSLEEIHEERAILSCLWGGGASMELGDPRWQLGPSPSLEIQDWHLGFPLCTLFLYFLYLMCIPIREICKPNTSSIYLINLYLIFSSIVSFNCLILIPDLCWVGLTTLLDACLGISLVFTFMACRVEIDICSWLGLGVD